MPGGLLAFGFVKCLFYLDLPDAPMVHRPGVSTGLTSGRVAGPVMRVVEGANLPEISRFSNISIPVAVSSVCAPVRDALTRQLRKFRTISFGLCLSGKVPADPITTRGRPSISTANLLLSQG